MTGGHGVLHGWATMASWYRGKGPRAGTGHPEPGRRAGCTSALPERYLVGQL